MIPPSLELLGQRGDLGERFIGAICKGMTRIGFCNSWSQPQAARAPPKQTEDQLGVKT